MFAGVTYCSDELRTLSIIVDETRRFSSSIEWSSKVELTSESSTLRLGTLEGLETEVR